MGRLSGHCLVAFDELLNVFRVRGEKLVHVVLQLISFSFPSEFGVFGPRDDESLEEKLGCEEGLGRLVVNVRDLGATRISTRHSNDQKRRGVAPLST